jgi:transcriptional regulator with XRE-family HTH domain
VRKHSPADLSTLAVVLITLRKGKGFSQERFASASQVDRAYVGGIERGERRPSFSVLEKLLTGLDITWQEFGAAVDREARRR